MDRSERHWQDTTGGLLQEHAYARAGTRVVLQEQFARVARALGLRPGLRVIDVGCGVGHLIQWLAAQVEAEYHGIDLSTESVKRARTGSPAASLVVGDVARLPYRDARFDRIVCNGAAHHFPDLGIAFAELQRILRPGGRIVLFEPVSSRFTNGLRHVLGVAAAESPADRDHKHDVGIADLHRALRAAGLVVLDTRLSDSLAYPLSGMYAKFPLAGSSRGMRAVLRLEHALQGTPLVRRLLDSIAWRVLTVATKPASAP